jgi:transposase
VLQTEEQSALKALHRQGQSIRALARLTGHSLNTIRTILRTAKVRTFKNPKRSSKLDGYKHYLGTRYLESQLSAVRLLAEIRAQGYSGSIDLLRRYLRTLKAQVHSAKKLAV